MRVLSTVNIVVSQLPVAHIARTFSSFLEPASRERFLSAAWTATGDSGCTL